MVGNSKVLTVSYGTFSCTLEGFDDSFDTMKAIAEYFRDLAAEDRYFGAEPPQPDAEVLARIAEKELARGVQARAEGHKVLLKPAAVAAPLGGATLPVEEPGERPADGPFEPVAEEPTEPAVEEAAEPEMDAPAEEPTDATVDTDATADSADQGFVAEVAEETQPEAEVVETPAAADASVVEADEVLEDVADATTGDAPSAEDDELEDIDDTAEAAELPEELIAAQPEVEEEDANFVAPESAVAEEESEVEAASLESDETPLAEAETAENEREEEPVADVADEIPLTAFAPVDAGDTAEDPMGFEAELNEELGFEFNADEASLDAPANSEDAPFDAEMAEFAETAEEVADAVIDDAPVAVEDTQTEDAVEEAQAEDEFEEALAEEAQAKNEAVEEADAAAENEASSPEDASEPMDEAEDIPAAPKPFSARASESLAAKLRRIQAVVGASKAAAAAKSKDSDGYTEDEHAEDFSAGVAATETTDEAPGDATDEASAPPRVLKMKRADFNAAMARATETAGPEAEETEDAAQISEEDEEITSIFAETAPEADEAEAIDFTAESSLSPEDEADLVAELAAVEAEAEKEAAGEVGDFDAVVTEAETLEDATDEDAVPETAPTDDTPAADARFEDEEEQAQPEEAATAMDAEDEEQTPSAPAEAAFADQEATMSRLMDEAEVKLDEPQSKSRRDAYSHLKAAVAAKQAAESMGENDPSKAENREGDYRDDLAKVVRPRRAEARPDGERTKRPAPAPLKLVASQRVDVPPEAAELEEQQAEVQVRPRRVPSIEPSAPAAPQSAGFADFAASAGASELGDVLEAAASYVTHVDGSDVFSRPQVMRIVQQAMPQGSFTREDGLRAFGTLLRQGRIKKIRGGQFEVTENTRFQPEARDLRAAG